MPRPHRQRLQFRRHREAPVGPQGFDVDSSLTDLYPTLDAVRIRQVSADSPLAETLDFHLDAFAHPLPKPAAFSHADPYPNFGVWDWEVVSDRRRPAFTVLENVSRAGFRSAVREWIPAGAALPEVKLSITSPPPLHARRPYPVTYIRLRDGKVRHATQKADARGRLTFDLDGDAYEIGIGADAGPRAFRHSKSPVRRGHPPANPFRCASSSGTRALPVPPPRC